MKDEIAYSGPDPHQREDEKTRRNFDAALGREADVCFLNIGMPPSISRQQDAVFPDHLERLENHLQISVGSVAHWPANPRLRATRLPARRRDCGQPPSLAHRHIG